MGFTTAVNLRVAGSGERACPVLPVDDHAAAEAEEHQQARYYPEDALEPLILVRPEACVAGVAVIVVDGDMRPGCQVFTPAFLVLHGPAAGRPVPDPGVVVSGTAAGVGVANAPHLRPRRSPRRRWPGGGWRSGGRSPAGQRRQ